MAKFDIETVSFDMRDNADEETLIRYNNKLFRLDTHIDISYDFQSHGILEYFNGTDFITIVSFSHKDMAQIICHEGSPSGNYKQTTGYRDEKLLKKVKGIISRYEKFMPHQEAKA